MSSDDRRGWVRDLLSVGVVVGLLSAVYLLPPDTSLREIKAAGTLRVCTPPEYPPLVVRDPARPGVDVEILQEIAARMGVRLTFSTNAAMARDFNPRNWRVSRAHCQMIAGGVTATTTTRNFIDTTPPHLETGWVVVVPGELPPGLRGMRVAFYAGISGLNRVALSRALREQGAQVTVIDSARDLVAGLRNGRYDAGVVESLTGSQLAAQHDLTIAWISGASERAPVAFGLWKGDLTLKREVVRILRDLDREGVLDRIPRLYGIEEIDLVLPPPSPA